jgi:hypothetical protein
MTTAMLDALAERRDALQAEVAEKTRELEEIGRLLEDARRRQRLPVLEAMSVSAPCRAEWSKMDGDERVRHCGECKQYVYNLSAMTGAEAMELIESLERAPCVRYYERSDGTILFRDCAVTRLGGRRRRVLAVGAALAVGAGLAVLAELPPPEPAAQAEVEIVMGEIRWESELDGEPGSDADVAEGTLSEKERREIAVERAELVLRALRDSR